MSFEGPLYRWVCDVCKAEVLSTSRDTEDRVRIGGDLQSKGWVLDRDGTTTTLVLCPDCTKKVEEGIDKLIEKSVATAKEFVVDVDQQFSKDTTLGTLRSIVRRRLTRAYRQVVDLAEGAVIDCHSRDIERFAEVVSDPEKLNEQLNAQKLGGGE
jgi:hypothetical protein